MEKLHNPEIDDTFNEKNFYRRRLAFDELFAHQLAICIVRTIDNRKKSISFKSKDNFKNNLIKKFRIQVN